MLKIIEDDFRDLGVLGKLAVGQRSPDNDKDVRNVCPLAQTLTQDRIADEARGSGEDNLHLVAWLQWTMSCARVICERGGSNAEIGLFRKPTTSNAGLSSSSSKYSLKSHVWYRCKSRSYHFTAIRRYRHVLMCRGYRPDPSPSHRCFRYPAAPSLPTNSRVLIFFPPPPNLRLSMTCHMRFTATSCMYKGFHKTKQP